MYASVDVVGAASVERIHSGLWTLKRDHLDQVNARIQMKGPEKKTDWGNYLRSLLYTCSVPFWEFSKHGHWQYNFVAESKEIGA